MHRSARRRSSPRARTDRRRHRRELALLAGPAAAQQQTFRNERGQITGSSSTSGNVTTFRDRSGRMTGTAERMRDGSVQYRDAIGRVTTAPRR
jgi:YD repeat-containing protein